MKFVKSLVAAALLFVGSLAVNPIVESIKPSIAPIATAHATCTIPYTFQDFFSGGPPQSILADQLNKDFQALVTCASASPLTPETYGAKGNGTTNDAANVKTACDAATNQNVALVFANKYRFSQNETLACEAVFQNGAYITVDNGVTVTFSKKIAAPLTGWVFKGAGTTTLSTAPFVSVAWWGAYDAISTATDAGPGIRAAKGSNRTIYFPASSSPYLVKSTDGSAAPYPATVVPGVLFQSLNGLTISAYGATVQMSGATCTSLPAGYNNDCRRAETVFFDRTPGVVVNGLNVKGDPALTASGPSTEVAYVCVFNVVNGTFRDINIVTPSIRIGAGFCGDWIAHTTFQNVNVTDTNIICTDMAFLYDVTFDRVKCGGGGTGSVGFSFIYDTPNNAQNQTGISYTDTTNVRIINSDAAGYSSCAFISSGTTYRLNANSWHGCTNTNGGAVSPGGVLIHSNDQIAGGGVHPSDIAIADNFDANGDATTGGGDVFIAWNPALMTGSLDRVSVVNSTFTNPVSGISFQINGQTSHHSYLSVQSNSGVHHDKINVTQIAPQTDRFVNNPGYNPFGQANVSLPVGVGVGDKVTNTGPIPVVVHYWSSANTLVQHLILADGTTLDDGQAMSIGTATAVLNPGDAIYFTGSIPDGWFWVVQ